MHSQGGEVVGSEEKRQYYCFCKYLLSTYYMLCPIQEPIQGEGNGISLQYSCLENPMDGGAW